MPFYDSKGNELVAMPPWPPGGSQIDALVRLVGGSARLMGHVIRRRRVVYKLGVSVALSTLSSAMTFPAAGQIPTNEFDELLLFVALTGAVAGTTPANLLIGVQLYDPGSGRWINHATQPASIASPGVVAALLQVTPYTNFGGYMRFGAQLGSGSYSGGTLTCTLGLKG